MTSDALERHLEALPPVAVIYTDLDGTLLGPGGSLLTAPDGGPSPRAAVALCAAADAGVAVVPVSGRRRSQLQHDARLLGLDSCIAEVGTVIVRGAMVSYEWGEAPREGSNPHAALVGAADVLLSAFPDDLRPYAPWHTGREGSHLLHGRIELVRANGVLLDAGHGWAHLVDNGAASGWPGRQVRAYHLLPRGVGKAQAVRDDLRGRGLEGVQAMAIGDSAEDATMAEVVGTYVQVAGGHGVLAANAFEVAGAMGHGFAAAVCAALG